MKTDTLQTLIAEVERRNLESKDIVTLERSLEQRIDSWHSSYGTTSFTKEERDDVRTALIEMSSFALILATKIK